MRAEAQSRKDVIPAMTPVAGRLLQRKCACGGAPGADGECSECRNKRLQRKAEPGGRTPDVPSIVHDVLRSPGQPLDQGTRAFLEPRFGHDFSRVRVHTDARAGQSASAVGALAYTVGQDVVFGPGRYEPATNEGRRLIAHEVTHTLQQKVASEPSAPLIVNEPGDRYEREAQRFADRALGQALPFGDAGRSVIDASSSSGLTLLLRQDEGNGEEADSAAEEEEGGLCIRTPLGPGTVLFNGCTPEQLSDFAVIPEDGDVTTTPENGVSYDSDGFWYRNHSPASEWFKVSNHCDLEVRCTASGISFFWCCNVAASCLRGTPHWTSDGHDAENPFED